MQPWWGCRTLNMKLHSYICSNVVRMFCLLKMWLWVVCWARCTVSYSGRKAPSWGFGSGSFFFIFGRIEVFCTCVTACQTMKDERYLNFSAIAHSEKQISLRISSIVFSNASVGTLLIKLGDNALYVLFGSYIKTEEITASRSMLFSNAVAFNLIKLQ